MTTTIQSEQDNCISGPYTPASLSTYKNTEEAALAYAQSGLSVHPVKQDKTPAIKKLDGVMKAIAMPKEISAWYSDPSRGVGINCGAVSGYLECIDIDEKYNIDPIPLLDQLSPLVEELAPGLMAKLVHETSINGGHHLVYRCRTIEGSKKLARRKPTEDELTESPKLKSTTLIETRGEGGYFVAYPSPGYTLISGSFECIPEISVEERQILMDCARSLNQISAEEKHETGIPKKRSKSIVLPGEDFNLRGEISEVLEEAGWTYVYTHLDVQYWRRPGKKTGISASFNKHPNMFYVFTSNASPLESETWYTKFALLGLLRYNGNFSFAAKDLTEEGYGETTTAKAESYLKDRYNFRYNEVKGRVEFKKANATAFRTLEEYDLNSITREINRAHIQMSKANLAYLLESDYSPRFDPFKDYFESLQSADPAFDYIGQLAETVTLTDKAMMPVFKEYLKKWLVATVGCAIDPDTVNHTCLTLVGAQGRYKSTWLNMLVPKALSEYKVSDTIDPSDNDSKIHLSECFLINLDELETLNKHELGALKSLMTYQTSRVRKPYDKYAGQIIRRASFVGSINRGSFLTDETGSRRFLIFEIDMIDVHHKINLDNVYAQAYKLLKEGYRHWFDRAETDVLNTRNEEFAVQTTEDELLEKYAQKPDSKASGCEWYSATEIAKHICEKVKYPFGKTSARDFGYALKKAKYPWKKSGGNVRYALEFVADTQLHPTSVGVDLGVLNF